MEILVERDGYGMIATYPAIPQLYGFGETEEEAIAMLKREIRSLRADLEDGTPVSSEFETLKPILILLADCK